MSFFTSVLFGTLLVPVVSRRMLEKAVTQDVREMTNVFGTPLWQEWIDGNLVPNDGYILADGTPVSRGTLFGLPTGASWMSPLPDISFKVDLKCEDHAHLDKQTMTERLQKPPMDISSYIPWKQTFDGNKVKKTITETMHGFQVPNIDVYYEDEAGNVLQRAIGNVLGNGTADKWSFKLGKDVLPCKKLSINVVVGFKRSRVWHNETTGDAEMQMAKMGAELDKNDASGGGDYHTAWFDLAKGVAIPVDSFSEGEKHTMAFKLTQTCDNFKGQPDFPRETALTLCYPGKQAMVAFKLTKTASDIYGWQVAIYLRKDK